MLIRSLSFCCGVFATLLFLFLGRFYNFGLDYDTFSTNGHDLIRTNASAGNLVVDTNGSSVVTPTVKYSVDDAVANSTLGVSELVLGFGKLELIDYQFEKILAINLPSRPDRRDLLTLGALHTGVKLEWIDGVDGADLSQKAWPVVRGHVCRRAKLR